MAYKIEQDEELNFTRLSLSGLIDLPHLIEALRSLLTFPRFNWRLLLVYEHGAKLELSGNDIRSLSHVLAAERPADAPFGRTAVVAPNELIFGLNRMHQVYSEDLPSDSQVFRDIEEAIEWLVQI